MAENIAAVEEEYDKSAAERERWGGGVFRAMDERKFYPTRPP